MASQQYWKREELGWKHHHLLLSSEPIPSQCNLFTAQLELSALSRHQHRLLNLHLTTTPQQRNGSQAKQTISCHLLPRLDSGTSGPDSSEFRRAPVPQIPCVVYALCHQSILLKDTTFLDSIIDKNIYS